MSRRREPPEPWQLIAAAEQLRIIVRWTCFWLVIWGLISLVW